MGKVRMEEELDDIFAVDEEEEAGARSGKYLLFNLAGELYGINITGVIEIIEMQKINAVPDMPAYIKGVINLRGKIIPVMDLRLRFGIPGREYDDRTCVIIARIETASLGMIVDTVAEVHEIKLSDIEPAPSFTDGVTENYIEGIGKDGGRVAVLIDARKIFRSRDVLPALLPGEEPKEMDR